MRYVIASLVVVGLACSCAARAQTPRRKPASTPAVALQELVVTGQASRNQVLLDRKVYAVSNDLQATTGSAAEILNTVPSVTVDADGNVSLRGDANVTILVDGKPSAQFAGATRGLSLQQFPASDIEKIEVLANPPAQYKAEGAAGVINIVTRKTRKAGLSGGGQASIGDHGRFVLGLNGNYNRGKLKLSGSVGLRRDIRERLTSSDRTVLDPLSSDLVLSRQTIDERFHRMIPQIKASLDYQLNDRQSFGASFSHRELIGGRHFDQHDQSGPQAGAATSLSDRHSDGHEWSVDGSQGLHLDQKLWRPGETLSLALQHSVTRERERYAYRNTLVLPVADPSFDDLHLSLDLEKTEVSADYDLPMSGDRDMKLGYDLEDDRNAFDNVGDTIDPATDQPVTNPAVTNHFRYRQQVNAGYAQYQAPLGPWRLQAGLRLEAADISTLQITGNIPGGRHDFGAYPSLSLDRSLGETGKLTASASRRITRPDPEALNPFSDHQDTHNLRAGNPNLLPQDTWSFQLGYSGAVRALTFGATAYYRLDRNSVTDIVQPVSADVVLSTKTNLPRSRSEGLEFNANGKLGSKLSYGLSGNLFHTQIDAASLGAPGLRSTTGLNLKANLDYRPTSVDTFQISFTRQDRRLTPQGYVSPINLVNLGYRRQLRPDLSVVATVADLFDGQKVQRQIDTPLLQDVTVRHQIGRIAFVGLVYTFGAQKKGKPSSFEYDQ